MVEEMEQQQQQPAPPPPSYRALGLTAKFVNELKARIAVATRLSKLEKVKALHTDTLKAMFVKAILQVETNPADDDFKDLVKALPDMGAMCSVIGYRVGIIPGERSAIDSTKLRLTLTNYDLSLKQIDEIVAASTTKSTWGEFSMELLNPNGGKKKGKKKAPRKKKVAAPVTLPPADPPKNMPVPKAPAKPKVKAPTRNKKG